MISRAELDELYREDDRLRAEHREWLARREAQSASLARRNDYPASLVFKRHDDAMVDPPEPQDEASDEEPCLPPSSSIAWSKLLTTRPNSAGKSRRRQSRRWSARSPASMGCSTRCLPWSARKMSIMKKLLTIPMPVASSICQPVSGSEIGMQRNNGRRVLIDAGTVRAQFAVVQRERDQFLRELAEAR